MKVWFSPLLAAVLSLGAVPAHAVPDCSKPNKTKVDWMLCFSDKAAAAEQIMAAAFRAAFNRVQDQQALLEEQEGWGRDVRDACNDVPCLVKAYRERASALETY